MDKAPDFTYDNTTPMKTLLERGSAFDLVNGTFVKIGNRYEHSVKVSQYTEEERVIMLVWHSSGIIGNGGFAYLFSGEFDGDPEFKITADAHRIVGLIRSYEAFQDAFQLFSNGIVPSSTKEQISQDEMSADSLLDDINRKYWQDGWSGLREELLATYIRTHLTKLGNLDCPK